jgi:hypothetical protein
MARSVSWPSTVFRRLVPFGFEIRPLTPSAPAPGSVLEAPHVDDDLVADRQSDRMLASTGKSSLIAFLTMVNPDTLITLPLQPRMIRGEAISTRVRRRSKPVAED